MLEEEFKADNLNIKNEKSESENQVDKFSQTTKLLDKELKDKKENISKVLEEGNLKGIFENLLSSEDGELCIMSLLECENNEEEIKKIILANLPEGYAYNVSTGNIVETQVNEPNTNFTGATTTDKKGETAAQDKETAAEDKETAAEDKKTVEEIEKNLDTEEIMKEVIKERDRLVDKYQEQNFDAKTNKESTNFQTVKTQLENNGVLNQLRQTHDDKFIDDYILAQTTLLELKSNRSSYEEADISYFDKIVKNLNNACNIPDTSLSSFNEDNIAQTRTELFNKDSGVGNESLKTARDNNMDSHKEAYGEIFPEMGDDEVVAKYGKFLEGDLKAFWQQYETNRDVIKNKIAEIRIIMMNQQIFNENGENYISDEEKILWNNYKKMLSVTNEIRKETEKQTKNLMEEMCIISQIKGMYMCMGEGDDFNLNKANEIINDNGVLTLKGHIDGVDFSVRHDTINPNQRLKIKSKLGVDSEDQNTFEIGKDESYVDSPFILPRQDEIFGVISEVVKSNDIKNYDSWDSYSKNLQKTIIGKVDEVYKDAEFAHHYITNKVKGEKILDSSLSLIQGIKPDIDLTKPINQASNEKLHSLLKIINFNIENSTTEEKNKLNQCITKIQDIKNTYRNNSGNEGELSVAYPPIIEHYLKNEAWLNDGDEESKLGLVVDLLSYYNQNSKDTRANLEGSEGAPSKMIIEDLYRDLFEFQTNQSLVAATRKNEETEKQDKQEADGILDLNNSAIWPPVGEVA